MASITSTPTFLPPLVNDPASMQLKADARPIARATRFDALTTILAWAICSVAVIWALCESTACSHWFIIPVFFSGVIITLDMVDWFRGRFNVFDPVGLLGVFGFHFFFMAPLLHVVWDWWMTDRTIRIADLRPGWDGWQF